MLLEDLGNLAANELYSPAGAGEEGALDAILEGIGKLRAQCRALVVVSNEIFAGGRDYAPGTEAYLSLMAGPTGPSPPGPTRCMRWSADCPLGTRG